MSDIVTDERLGEGSELCTSCGLCCQGILEKAAVLEPGEVELARELDLKPFVTGGGMWSPEIISPII